MSWLSQALGQDAAKRHARNVERNDPLSETNTNRRVADTMNTDQQAEADARRRAREAGDAADQSIGRAENFDPTESRGQNFDDVRNFDPSASRNVNTSDLRNFSARNIGAWKAPTGVGDALANYRGNAQASFDPAAATKFRSNNLESFNADDVSGFDPSQFGKEFAGGAAAEARFTLNDALADLEASAARGGRTNTGFFDKDKGMVATRVFNDLNSKIAQQAGVFSGQRLSALSSGAGMRLDRARGIDENSRSMSALGAELGLRRAQGIDENSLAAMRAGADLNLSANELALRGATSADELAQRSIQGATGVEADLAGNIDRMRQTGINTAADLDSSRRRFIDESRQRAGEFGASGRFDRERFAGDTAERAADRYRDQIASRLDRVHQGQQDREARRQANWQTGVNLVGAVAGMMPQGRAGRAASRSAGG